MGKTSLCRPTMRSMTMLIYGMDDRLEKDVKGGNKLSKGIASEMKAYKGDDKKVFFSHQLIHQPTTFQPSNYLFH
jgi:hypothetical protein